MTFVYDRNGELFCYLFILVSKNDSFIFLPITYFLAVLQLSWIES